MSEKLWAVLSKTVDGLEQVSASVDTAKANTEAVELKLGNVLEQLVETDRSSRVRLSEIQEHGRKLGAQHEENAKLFRSTGVTLNEVVALNRQLEAQVTRLVEAERAPVGLEYVRRNTTALGAVLAVGLLLGSSAATWLRPSPQTIRKQLEAQVTQAEQARSWRALRDLKQNALSAPQQLHLDALIKRKLRQPLSEAEANALKPPVCAPKKKRTRRHRR